MKIAIVQVVLYNEPAMKYHVEDPKELLNGILYVENDFGNFIVTAQPKKVHNNKSTECWKMYFDGVQSKNGAGARIVFTSPQGEVTTYSYHVQFECTNNIVEYEALLLGLELARKLKIKCLTVVGDFDLIVRQVKDQFATKNERLKNYKNVVWDNIKLFNAFGIKAVPRVENSLANALVVAATTLQSSDALISTKCRIEIIFRPCIPNNEDHWQVFDDDAQIIRFLSQLGEFEAECEDE